MRKALRIGRLTVLAVGAVAALMIGTGGGLIGLQRLGERRFQRITLGADKQDVLRVMGPPEARLVKWPGLRHASLAVSQDGEIAAPMGAFSSADEYQRICRQGREAWSWKGVADQRFGLVFNDAERVIATWSDY